MTEPSVTPRRRLAAGLLLPLILVACGGTTASPSASVAASGPPASASGSPSTAPSPSNAPSVSPSASPSKAADLILEVASEGGFINPTANLAALPTVVVYRDGRILTVGVPPADLTDPLLPRVSVRDVGTTGADAIEAAIVAAGLDKPQTG